MPITEGTTVFSTCLATTDGPDEPASCDFFGYTHIESDIWYRYFPSCSGEATVSLCDSSYDTKMAVYRNNCPTGYGEAIACNDDYCSVQSHLTFPVTTTDQYLIRIGGFRAGQGTGSMTIFTNPGDLNFDCKVNLVDFARLDAPWTQDGCVTPTWCGYADINHDSIVNFQDLTILVEHWLEN